MSELMKPNGELWFDGPNYTADVLIIDQMAEKILLIERSDCGEWALPGGFVDKGETTTEAAKREAREEVSIELGDGQLIFRGVVNDPRNSEHAWIETSAYLFDGSSHEHTQAGDDARTVQWFALDELPPLYASHQEIIEHALNSLAESTDCHTRYSRQ